MAETTTLESFTKIIRQLMEEKSRRDGKKFTSSKLAKATNMHRSILHRILSGEAKNPQFETMAKIIKFFVEDGFYLPIENILGLKTELPRKKQVISKRDFLSLPLHKMQNFTGTKIGNIAIALTETSPGTIAVITHEDIDVGTIFKSGSIFVVDMLKKPTHGNLVTIKEDGNEKLQVKKYIVEDEKPSLFLAVSGQNISESEKEYSLIGVVTHINAKI